MPVHIDEISQPVQIHCYNPDCDIHVDVLMEERYMLQLLNMGWKVAEHKIPATKNVAVAFWCSGCYPGDRSARKIVKELANGSSH